MPLEIDTSVEGWRDRYTWHEFPEIIEQQPLHFWQHFGLGGGPSASYGIITFEVLTDGPVLLAVTDRWGGGGNASGDVDWIPQLTTYDEFIQQGWTEYASPMLIYNHQLDIVGENYFTVFRRDSVAGERFTLRTEKYWPPLPLTTQFNEVIPEPSTFIIWSLLGALTITIGWWRRRRAA